MKIFVSSVQVMLAGIPSLTVLFFFFIILVGPRYSSPITLPIMKIPIQVSQSGAMNFEETSTMPPPELPKFYTERP